MQAEVAKAISSFHSPPDAAAKHVCEAREEQHEEVCKMGSAAKQLPTVLTDQRGTNRKHKLTEGTEGMQPARCTVNPLLR